MLHLLLVLTASACTIIDQGRRAHATSIDGGAATKSPETRTPVEMVEAGSPTLAGSGGRENTANAGTPAAGSRGSAAGSNAAMMMGADAPTAGRGDSPAAGSGGASGEPVHTDGTDPNVINPYPGFKSDIYAQDRMWMCRPGLVKNYCLDKIADATEALPGGTFKPYVDQLGSDHPIDCLFWYTTVRRTEDPISLDFSDPEPMLASIRGQAARFSRVCNVYAPFYRQMPLGGGGDAALGYMDVVQAFKHYIANWNKGRSFVIFGHSQGSGVAIRLLKDEIDGNPELRKRLVSALLIGAGLTAATFQNIPPCKSPTQVGCAIGYRSYGEPQMLSAVPAGLVCTNPGALGGGKVKLKGSFFEARGSAYSMDLGPEFTAPWGLFRGFFEAECVDAPSGGQVLRINYVDGDSRKRFLDLSREVGFGLHMFDYQLAMDDLIELVRAQRDAKLKM